MAKKTNSVPELLRDMGLSKKIVKQVGNKIQDSEIAKTLTILRTLSNLSAEELSKKLGVSKRSVMCFETKSNKDLKLSNIVKYANALEFKVSLKFKSKSKSKEIDLNNLFC